MGKIFFLEHSVILFLVLLCAYVCVYTRLNFFKYFVMSLSSSQIACSFDFNFLLCFTLNVFFLPYLNLIFTTQLKSYPFYKIFS